MASGEAGGTGKLPKEACDKLLADSDVHCTFNHQAAHSSIMCIKPQSGNQPFKCHLSQGAALHISNGTLPFLCVHAAGIIRRCC
jgi:hypothetical protein